MYVNPTVGNTVYFTVYIVEDLMNTLLKVRYEVHDP